MTNNPVRVAGAGTNRAQANLPAFAIAVLVVTSTATISLLVVNGSFVAADREPLERTRASGLAAAMVDADSPITDRANVVNETLLDELDAELATWFPASRNAGVRVTLGDRILVERGTPAGGTTIRRLVLVSTPHDRTIEPAFTSSETAVTLPRRATGATLHVTPPNATTVSTVRVNDRVVLYEPDGLNGSYHVSLTRFETATIRFDANGSLPQGSVRIRYRPSATRKAVLAVTVDA